MPATVQSNVLYYGDNLDILRRYIPDESVDLVYLDPPFNSNRDYNVIFKDESGRKSDAQLVAFEDTWHWGPAAESVYAYLTNTARHEGRVPESLTRIIAALRSAIGENQMMAYLVEMSVRLVGLRRVLKRTGSLYLHCDPTASHYLKVILDGVFGPRRFRTEIVWQRSYAHSDTRQGRRQHGHIHDTILFYSKTDEWTWNPLYTKYDDRYLGAEYRHIAPDGRRYKETDPTAAKPGGDTEYDWWVKRPVNGKYRWEADLDDGHLKPLSDWQYKAVRPYNGRYWGYSKQNLIEFARSGKLIHRKTGMPRVMQFADEMPGVALQDIWSDIAPALGKEDLGYPTQKPVALLERIIGASSNPGDIVLDPFCGCGTALGAAQKLGRKWIGIDITYLAIAVMRARLYDAFGLEDVPVIGQPTEVEGARQLAQSPEGRYQFQWWALNLVDAKPIGGAQKKGADRGIDGIITFTDQNNELKTVVVSVKSGHVNSGMVRDLKGTLEREKAAIGLFITLEEPTKEMRLEANSSGLYHSDLWHRDYSRLQILTIKELLEQGKKPALPPFVMPTYQQAERVRVDPAEQQAFEGLA